MLRSSLWRGLIALGLVGCAPSSAAEAVRRSGTLADAPAYLSALHESLIPDAYVIVDVEGGPDFVQFTAFAEGIELNMPLITEHQRTLEPRFRMVAAEVGLAVRESRGSDGSRFLDIDLPTGPAAGDFVQEFIARLFELDEGAQLVFSCHGC